MTNLLTEIPDVLLMGPGPSTIHPEVYKALATSTLGHMDGDFIGIMDEIKRLLKITFRTENDLTVAMSGTGSAGMETVFVNLVEKGDRVLVLENGVFGKRMIDVAERLGAEVEVISREWGTAFEPAELEKKLDSGNYDIVALVHAETSTGVRNPAESIGPMAKKAGALFILDTVTSLGGIPVEVDDWGVDACYSGTQKCLSVPPGLSPVTFSPEATEKLKSRKTKVPNWYLDLSMITQYWEGSKRSYHHTAPINMLYALYRSLLLLEEEGQDGAFARHRECHELLVDGLSALGLSLLVDPPYRLPMLNAVVVPEGVDEAAVRKTLRKEHNIEIGAGLGPLAGKIWRVGVMGYTAQPKHVERFLLALGDVLS
ncbi:MAG: pyridoxal-phosphate-dependent aminotransferase family protein [Spirochaetota bacterium]